MISLRIMISALVAMAIAVAPVSAAWASVMEMPTKTAVTAVGGIDFSSEAHANRAMDDCVSAMDGTVTSDGCSCCELGKECTPQLCGIKCFQLVGIAGNAIAQFGFVGNPLRHASHERSTRWLSRPRLPPPRT